MNWLPEICRWLLQVAEVTQQHLAPRVDVHSAWCDATVRDSSFMNALQSLLDVVSALSQQSDGCTPRAVGGTVSTDQVTIDLSYP